MNKTITVYELLGLIKDGKALKKIKFDDTEYKYGNGYYYRIDNEMPKIFTNEYNIFLCLNDKVEVLEEDKPIIEKLNLDREPLKGREVPRAIDYLLEGRINEIIDYINRKENK